MESKNKKDGGLIWILLLTGFGLLIFGRDIDHYIDSRYTPEKIQYFKYGKTLKCHGGSNFGGELYLIEKKSGWKVYNDIYFKKGDLIIDITRCKY